MQALVARIGDYFPHIIVYPAVVGLASATSEKELKLYQGKLFLTIEV